MKEGAVLQRQEAKSMIPKFYCISTYSHVYPEQSDCSSTPWYEGQIVFAGPDAAIEVKDGVISGYINGAPCSPRGQLALLIDRYEQPIRRQTRDLASAHASVVLAGKWHHVDPSSEPRFEGYLIHLISNDGTAVTRRYVLDIFEWDDEALNNGSGFFAGGGKNARDNALELQGHAELKLGPGKCFAENGLHGIEGVIWFPEDSERHPIVYSNVNGPGAPARSDRESVADSADTSAQLGDGTVVGELRARSRMLKVSPGEFRGKTVDRRTHRPAEMTLEEAFASTDALGYWVQTQGAGKEPHMVFRFSPKPGDAHRLLQYVDANTDPLANGSAYASEWQPISRSMPGYRQRLLAVGTVPGVSVQPL